MARALPHCSLCSHLLLVERLFIDAFNAGFSLGVPCWQSFKANDTITIAGPRDTKAGKNASRKSVLRGQQEKKSGWDFERVYRPKLGIKYQGFKHLYTILLELYVNKTQVLLSSPPVTSWTLSMRRLQKGRWGKFFESPKWHHILYNMLFSQCSHVSSNYETTQKNTGTQRGHTNKHTSMCI